MPVTTPANTSALETVGVWTAPELSLPLGVPLNIPECSPPPRIPQQLMNLDPALLNQTIAECIALVQPGKSSWVALENVGGRRRSPDDGVSDNHGRWEREPWWQCVAKWLGHS